MNEKSIIAKEKLYSNNHHLCTSIGN